MGSTLSNILKIGTIVSITIIVVGLDFGFTWDGMEGEGCGESSAALETYL